MLPHRDGKSRVPFAMLCLLSWRALVTSVRWSWAQSWLQQWRWVSFLFFEIWLKIYNWSLFLRWHAGLSLIFIRWSDPFLSTTQEEQWVGRLLCSSLLIWVLRYSIPFVRNLLGLKFSSTGHKLAFLNWIGAEFM